MRIALIILIILSLGMTGSTVFYWDANRDADQEISNLRIRVNTISKALDDVETARAQEVSKVQLTYDSLLQDLRKEIELGQIKIKQAQSKLSVSIVEKVLFPSGKAEISDEGKQIIGRVGALLKNNTGKLIRVEGHTDNVRIHPNLQKTYASNWELSSARASRVARYLNDDVGIAGERLRAVGMGPYHPVAKNATAEGRKWNRRVEIALIPDPAYKGK